MPPPPPRALLLVLGNCPTTRETHAVTSQTTHDMLCLCVYVQMYKCTDACVHGSQCCMWYYPIRSANTRVYTPPPPSSPVFPNATISVTITITVTPSPFLVVSRPFTRYILYWFRPALYCMVRRFKARSAWRARRRLWNKGGSAGKVIGSERGTQMPCSRFQAPLAMAQSRWSGGSVQMREVGAAKEMPRRVGRRRLPMEQMWTAGATPPTLRRSLLQRQRMRLRLRGRRRRAAADLVDGRL
jgi:hypothetical protein